MIDTKLLKSKLALAGLTIRSFGEHLGWTRSTTYRKVNGLRPFTVPDVIAAAKLLLLTPEEVMAIFFKQGIS